MSHASHRRRLLPGIRLPLLGALAAAGRAGAQTTPPPAPPTLDACYVPASGTIYRIDTPTAPAPGAPKACLSQTHVRFTWNQQGPAGPKGDKGDPGTGGTVGPDLDLAGTLKVAKSATVAGGLVATDGGTLAVPTGAGARLLWVPQRGAFRAGSASGSLWDDPTTFGRGSIGLGTDANASAEHSTAIGHGTVASQQGAVAVGWFAKATNHAAVSVGAGFANGRRSLALGVATAGGNGSIAMGEYGHASAAEAIAIGGTASGQSALALRGTASGERSIALAGTASGVQSTAIGEHASTNGQAGAFVYADATGPAQADAENQFVVGASGGVRLRTSPDRAQGCDVVGAGTLTCTGAITTGGGLVATDAGRLALPQGPGTRLMWVPQKGALRVGEVTDGRWNDAAAFGQGSMALGRNGIASGARSLALGSGAITSADDAISIGTIAVSNAPRTIAIGNASSARRDNAIVIGTTAEANDTYAISIGSGKSNGYSAIVLGEGSTSGRYAISVGTGSASGRLAIAIGTTVTASGDQSLALGSNASTEGHAGAIVIGDGSAGTVTASAANQLVVRAAGGALLYSDAGRTAGVTLAPGGGSWQSVSDVRRKTAFRDVDGEQLLGRIAALPIRTWQYRAQDARIRHIGPTAQDFHRAFAVGESDTTITSVDADGVALAGVQALAARLRALQAETVTLRATNARLLRRFAALERTVVTAVATRAAATRSVARRPVPTTTTTALAATTRRPAPPTSRSR